MKIYKKKNIIYQKIKIYIFLKLIITEELKGPKVEYEVYYPLIESQLLKVNLSLCSDVKIDVSIPINLSSSEIIILL